MSLRNPLPWDWRLASRMGTFRRGAGRKRLESVGLGDCWGVNLLPPYPECGRWDATAAALNAAAFMPELHRFRVIVLLGRRVADAFAVEGAGELPPQLGSVVHVTHGPLSRRVLLLPHPSGLCRMWNDEKFMERARRLVADARSCAQGVHEESLAEPRAIDERT